MQRPNWTREQLIRVMALYCQIPFGRMHQGNPRVKVLAVEIGRTPEAVAYKLTNLASLDPELRKRGIKGMANASKADAAIWNEFYGRWDDLAEYAVEETTPEPRTLERRAPQGPTEIMASVKVRRGQCYFRDMVLAAHDSTCCVTGISQPELLRASHIVPWAADAGMRLDPRNGLCLNALHDAAFDRGLVTLAEDWRLLVSRKLKKAVPDATYAEMFKRYEGEPARQPERFSPTAEM